MMCRICSNDQGNQLFSAREMMFGFRDEFEYLLCSNCGCLQIVQYPVNIEKYYPKTYYSFEEFHGPSDHFLKKYLRQERALYCITRRGFVGKVLTRLFPGPLMFDLLRICNARLDSDILEIGSGSGEFLIALKKLGFKNLTGVDPFVHGDISYNNSIRILKKNMSDLDGVYDLIIAKDTIEHMPHQLDTFKHIFQLLHPRGSLLITVPIIGYAWSQYGIHWVGLDAPRHYYLHTLKSLKHLVEKTGFEIIHILYVSNEDQFIGSEQYRMDIAICDERSYFTNPNAQIFSKEKLAEYKQKAKELNKGKDGDRISVCLRKK